MNALKELINNPTEKNLMEDVDKTCDKFLKKYSNHRMAKNMQMMQKIMLQKECKKKNTLYRQFIKYRTIETVQLILCSTNTMRTCNKEYYKKILQNNKNNIKGIWSALNSIIRNGFRKTSYP